MYYVRWQEKIFGRYEWRYLHNFEIYSNHEIHYTMAYGQEGAVQLPEAVAEWICELLDTQDDLNPEMVRVTMDKACNNCGYFNEDDGKCYYAVDQYIYFDDKPAEPMYTQPEDPACEVWTQKEG